MSCGEGDILLSILVASLPERIEFLSQLYKQVVPQTTGKPVEILVLTDNRTMSIGQKRQVMNEIAKGKYVVHVDDDDTIAEDYVDLLLEKIREDRFDVINFICMVHIGNETPKPCYYSKNFNYANLQNYNLRKPNSRCCFRKETALRQTYYDYAYGEDDEWAERIAPFIRRECIIDKVLYNYRWVEKDEDWFVTMKERKDSEQMT
jgi:glycosyltransferase involved in cell wall biosynthesis